MRLFSGCSERWLFSGCSVLAPHYSDFSCCGAGALGRVGFCGCGSWALEHRLNSCGAQAQACGVFPYQGSNLCLLPWEVGSLPLNHRGSPEAHVLHSKTMQLEQGTPPGIHLVIGKVFSFTSWIVHLSPCFLIKAASLITIGYKLTQSYILKDER